jgi:hypothetical protein
MNNNTYSQVSNNDLIDEDIMSMKSNIQNISNTYFPLTNYKTTY